VGFRWAQPAEKFQQAAGRAAIEGVGDLATSKTVCRSKSFDKPGTYFVARRVAAQRKDAFATPFAKLRDLGRVRVVVA
jgi:hypothetical protein